MKTVCAVSPLYLTCSEIQLSKIDVRLLRSVTGMQQLEAKLDSTSAYDYRSIVVPLLKSFLRVCSSPITHLYYLYAVLPFEFYFVLFLFSFPQARLEELADKDATEKSDAAREAFLAELDLDSRKGNGGGVDSSRHLNEKLKDKRKNKDHKKSKDSKVGTE